MDLVSALTITDETLCPLVRSLMHVVSPCLLCPIPMPRLSQVLITGGYKARRPVPPVRPEQLRCLPLTGCLGRWLRPSHAPESSVKPVTPLLLPKRRAQTPVLVPSPPPHLLHLDSLSIVPSSLLPNTSPHLFPQLFPLASSRSDSNLQLLLL